MLVVDDLHDSAVIRTGEPVLRWNGYTAEVGEISISLHLERRGDALIARGTWQSRHVHKSLERQAERRANPAVLPQQVVAGNKRYTQRVGQETRLVLSPSPCAQSQSSSRAPTAVAGWPQAGQTAVSLSRRSVAAAAA